MTEYVIEDGILLPDLAPAPKTLGETLDEMKPGQSVLVSSSEARDKAISAIRLAARRHPDRKYVFFDFYLPGVRIWRVE